MATQELSLPDIDLGSIDSVNAALAALLGAGIEATVIEDFGDGFAVVDKDRLVGVPFVIVRYREQLSEQFKSGFAILHVVAETEDGTVIKGVITDGGTGINEQCRKIASERGGLAGIVVRQGLVKSEYDTVVNINGEDRDVHGTTYYFAGM